MLPCRQEVLQLDNEIVFNEAIIEERELAIQEIQQQIGEVHEAFKDLATLVHAQGVTIGMVYLTVCTVMFFGLLANTRILLVAEEIDTHIENSAEATKEAKTEVGKASKTQKSNSSLV
jgi:syntaxin 7